MALTKPIQPTKKPKSPYEIRTIGENRIGIYHNGIAVGVVYSQQELEEWFNSRGLARKKSSDDGGSADALEKAIRRL